MKFYVAIIAIFFVLALLQASFLSHLLVGPVVFNLFFILFFVGIFTLGNRHPDRIVALIVIAGIYSDLVFTGRIGLSIAIFLSILGLKKMTDHFIKHTQTSDSWGYFMALFLMSFCLYIGALTLARASSILPLHLNLKTAMIIAGNGCLAGIVFYFYKKIWNRYFTHRQLKLL